MAFCEKLSEEKRYWKRGFLCFAFSGSFSLSSILLVLFYLNVSYCVVRALFYLRLFFFWGPTLDKCQENKKKMFFFFNKNLFLQNKKGIYFRGIKTRKSGYMVGVGRKEREN